jgi:hypothetical protein
LTNQLLNSLPHFSGCFVGEGDCQDLRGPKLFGGKQVCDSMSEHSGLTTTRSSHNQQGFPTVQHSLALLRI